MAPSALFAFLLLTLSYTFASQEPTQRPIGVVDETSQVIPCVPFLDFLKLTRNATYQDFNETRVDGPQAFQDIKNHILRTYADVSNATSFVLDNDTVDCIAIMEQPAIRRFNITKLASFPNETVHCQTGDKQPPGKSSSASSPLEMNLTDPYGNAIFCPAGTIPMPRLTLERLTTFRTLSDFFAKRPRSLGPVNSDVREPEFGAIWEATHLHAAGGQTVPNYGGNSWLNVWRPSGDFSLSQQWYSTGAGSSAQTVEGGWQVYPDRYGSTEPRLFVFYTADGYQSTGCYNLDCHTFVMKTSKRPLGAGFSQLSTFGGDQRGFNMQWKLHDGQWFLFVEHEEIGYYPTELFDGGAMATQAASVEYGGEVTRKSGAVWPQMGSGKGAAAGWGQAALQRNIFYIDNDDNGTLGPLATLDGMDEAGMQCATIDITDSTTGSSWGTYFFFGGPGGMNCNRGGRAI